MVALLYFFPKSFLMIPGLAPVSGWEPIPEKSMDPRMLQLAQVQPSGWRFTASWVPPFFFFFWFLEGLLALANRFSRNLSVQSLQVQAAGCLPAKFKCLSSSRLGMPVSLWLGPSQAGILFKSLCPVPKGQF